jgi:FO synthase
MRRRVTFSRNVTLSLSRTCVSHCKYCAFATHRAHLHEPEEVERLLDGAARRNVKELLVLTGDEPGHHEGVRERLAALGFADFVAYVIWCCERALEHGLLPHTNLGALGHADLARLREVTRRRVLMSSRCVPIWSPIRDRRQRTRRCGRHRSGHAGGSARIPFTSGILVGIARPPPTARGARSARRGAPRARATCRRSSCRNFARTGSLTARSRG